MYHLGQLGYFPPELNLQFLKSVMIWKLEMQNLHLTKSNSQHYPREQNNVDLAQDHENNVLPDGTEEKFEVATTLAVGAVFYRKVI